MPTLSGFAPPVRRRTPVPLRLTPEEYFEWEETQEEKHDYIYGEVFPMPGSTEMHNIIAVNLLVALHRAFIGTECIAYTDGMRVQVEAGGRYTYPDLLAVCGERLFTTPKRTTLTNPTLLVEVLSDRTEAYDWGEKLDLYRGMASVQEIALVRQDVRAASVYRREAPERWTLEDVGADGTLALSSVGAAVPMADLYAGAEV